MSEHCPYYAAKGMHLYLGYRVAATGQAGEACHGCGRERSADEHLRIPAYRSKTTGAVSYGSPTHWQHPEDWEPVHVLTDDDLAQERAQALRDAADALPDDTEGPNRAGTARWPEKQRDAYSTAIEEAQAVLRERANHIEKGDTDD